MMKNLLHTTLVMNISSCLNKLKHLNRLLFLIYVDHEIRNDTIMNKELCIFELLASLFETSSMI